MKIIAQNDSNRLDSFLNENLSELTRSHIKKIILENGVKVNGKIEKPSKNIKALDEIEIEVPAPEKYTVKAEDIDIDIIYEDEYLAVINKPQGMVVHAGCGNKEGTLVNALMYHLDNLSGINGVMRPGIVHRIDKDTSGLLVVAKRDEAHLSLSKQIADKTCKRTYLALLEGILKEDSGRIETFIDRSPKFRTKMAVCSTGRKAITNFTVLKRYEKFTLCEFRLETGRTHQIRVHAKFKGHPIVGDKVYGYEKQKFELKGQLLHAYKLEFTHPKTLERMEFTAPLPKYFENVLEKIK